MSIDVMLKLEQRLDKDIEALQLLQQPVRRAFSALHVPLHGASMGKQATLPMPLSDERASAISLRLSYILPLLAACPAEPLDVDLVGFPSVAAMARGFLEPWFLLQYGHFSQFMPEVRRGYYTAEGDSPKGVVLSHASTAFAEQEARDVILTELSLAHGENPPSSLAREFDRLTAQGPPYDQRLCDQLFRTLQDHWEGAIHHQPLTGEKGFTAATGATLDEFRRFQAAAISLADFGRGIANALDRRINSRQGRNTDALVREMYRWITVCWRESRVVQLLCKLARLPQTPVEHLMSFFIWDQSQGSEGYQQFGDGFTPPFTRVGDYLLFAPEVLRRFVSLRNILYAVNRCDRLTFDNVLSQEFEPALVGAAQRLFSRWNGLRLAPNVKWRKKGEFDLLVFSDRENAALHVQAKATLPPQGARMVQATERRLEEGLRQLATFRGLAPGDADRVLSDALGLKVTGVHVVDVLLSTSSLGTDRIWSQLGGVVPINLTLLGLVVCAVGEGRELSLREFPTLVNNEISRLLTLGRPEWVHKEWVFPGANVWIPMLDLDIAAITRERALAGAGHLWDHVDQ